VISSKIKQTANFVSCFPAVATCNSRRDAGDGLPVLRLQPPADIGRLTLAVQDSIVAIPVRQAEHKLAPPGLGTTNPATPRAIPCNRIRFKMSQKTA
jgi:hypothetical protein